MEKGYKSPHVDDRRDLNPLLNLLIQIAVAAQALYLSGLRLADFGIPFGTSWDLGLWGWLASGLWLVGFTNIYNFMDGINGLAFSILHLLCLELCLLQSQPGLLCPLFEIAEIGLEFSKERANLSLVISLARCLELAFIN